MTTTAFRNLRALIQLNSVLLILINIPLPVVLFLNNRLTAIEVDNLKMGYLSITMIYKVVIIFNITLGMFASCGMNSKVKFYMRLYLLVTFLYMTVLLTYILYVMNLYQDYLVSTYVEKSAVSVQQRVIMSNLLYCSASVSCEGPLRDRSNVLIRYFSVVSIISFILHLLNFIFIKITVNISIEKPPVKAPTFVTVTRAGMDTQSLRTKRVMDVENTPSVSATHIV